MLLSNIQFVESRVYEDEDEPVKSSEAVSEVVTSEEKELKFKADIGNALSAGANFIQSAFDKVEVSQNLKNKIKKKFEIFFNSLSKVRMRTKKMKIRN